VSGTTLEREEEKERKRETTFPPHSDSPEGTVLSRRGFGFAPPCLSKSVSPEPTVHFRPDDDRLSADEDEDDDIDHVELGGVDEDAAKAAQARSG
jgi:hypothetical protein